MAMDFTVKAEDIVGFEVKIRAPTNLMDLDLTDRRFIAWLAPQLTRKLRRQILSGVSPRGVPFPDYTDAYKSKKKRKGKYRGNVDFAWSGGLLRSMQPIIKKEGKLRIGFTGQHPKAAYATDKISQKRLEAVRARQASGKALTAKQAKFLALAERGLRSMSNQHIADQLGTRYAPGDFRRGANTPRFPFMELTGKNQDWVEEQYDYRVIAGQLSKLPSTIKNSDLPANVQQFVTVEGDYKWRGKRGK